MSLAKILMTFTGKKPANQANEGSSENEEQLLQFVRIPWDGSTPQIVKARTVQAPTSHRIVPDVRPFYHNSIDAWYSIDYKIIPMSFQRVRECNGKYLAIFTMVQDGSGLSRNISTKKEVYGDIFLAKLRADKTNEFENVSDEIVGPVMIPAVSAMANMVGPEKGK